MVNVNVKRALHFAIFDFKFCILCRNNYSNTLHTIPYETDKSIKSMTILRANLLKYITILTQIENSKLGIISLKYVISP
jgi:hypothetical protein